MEIKKPTLIVDEHRVRNNIERMSKKAKKSGVRFRPHFKTHQSAEIGRIFNEYGVSSITASSIDMAGYFADHGWKDITVAVPVNIRQVDEINELARRVSLGVLVDSLSSAAYLAENVHIPIKTWIEIDSGDGRTGVYWEDTDLVGRIAGLLKESEKLSFAGLLTHAGQSYDQASLEQVEKVHRDSTSRMNAVRDHLTVKGFTGIEISTGDTPTCSIVDDFSGVDEIRPGNFVFNDLMQTNIGSCTEEDIAVAVACPVISKHPERNEIIIYGGGVHLAKDYLTREGSPCFGLVALPTETGWTSSIEHAWVAKISQEHGTIHAERDFIEETNIGDIVMVLPIHSCLTANLHRTYVTVDGKAWTSFQYEPRSPSV